MSASRLVWLGYTCLLPWLELRPTVLFHSSGQSVTNQLVAWVTVSKYWAKEAARSKGFCWLTVGRSSPSWWGRIGSRDRRKLVWSHRIYYQDTERDERWCSVHGLLFIQSGPPAHRWGCLPWGWVFPPLLTHSRKAPTDMPEVCFQVILSS